MEACSTLRFNRHSPVFIKASRRNHRVSCSTFALLYWCKSSNHSRVSSDLNGSLLDFEIQPALASFHQGKPPEPPSQLLDVRALVLVQILQPFARLVRSEWKLARL